MVEAQLIDLRVRIAREAKSGTHNFTHIFSGFEKIEAVRKTFGSKTDEVLKNLKVEVFPTDGFMGVSDEDGHIFASERYLRSGEERSIYLDIVHELVHVRQFMEGKELFDDNYAYVDRPTEIEAYRIGTEEARRIGLSEREIFDYLEVPWISKEEHERLARACYVRLGDSKEKRPKSRK
ncbi:MAG: hypothetical protein JRN52_14945 [Nitrososphaerota archaeon]|nr:hypothetical protein [Nitrososphaerota archaeon]